MPGIGAGKLRMSGILVPCWGSVQEERLLLFSPSPGISRSIRELSGSSSLTWRQSNVIKCHQMSSNGIKCHQISSDAIKCHLWTGETCLVQGELWALQQLILSRRSPLLCSVLWRLTLLWEGVAGVTEITVVRRAGEGEGVLASSCITGMILLLVRRAEPESLSRRTEVTTPDSWLRPP